jgi:hypothetical protein
LLEGIIRQAVGVGLVRRCCGLCYGCVPTTATAPAAVAEWVSET